MTFANALPWWVLSLLAATTAWLAWRSTAARREELRPWQRLALSGLRLAIVALIVAIVMRPVHQDAAGSPQVRLAIVVDRSVSMGLTDDEGRSRFEAAADLARTVAAALPARVRAETFTLGARLEAAVSGQARPDADFVDLDAALRDLRGDHPPFAGMLLLSDGAIEAGDVLGRDVPISVIGVGTDRRGPDRGIAAASAGEPIAPDESVDLDVTVVQNGSTGEPFDVRVAANGSPVETRRVSAPAPGVPAHLQFRVAPAADRPTTVTIDVPPMTGELTDVNNRATIVVPPPGTPRKVLVIEGGPGHEHSFLKRAWLADPGLVVDAVVRKGATDAGAPAYYLQTASDAADLEGGFPATLAALCRYDVIVLANAGAEIFTAAQMEQIAYFVAERGGGLVVLGRGAFDARAWRGAALEPLLPLDPVAPWRSPDVPGAKLGGVTLIEAGPVHPIVRLGGDGAETRAKWGHVPAPGEVFRFGGPRPGARVLAVASAAGRLQLPLVATQTFGRGRVLAFTGEASWRWKMQMPSTDRTFETFWRQAVRWASARRGPVAVSVSRTAAGRTVARVDVRDAAFTPVSDADVVVSATGPDGKTQDVRAVPRAVETGVYETVRDLDAAGPMRISASAVRRGVVLGTDTTWWAAPLDAERAWPWRDPGMLRRIAERTGGRVLAPADAPGWAASLDAASAPAPPSAPHDAWQRWWVLLVAVMLLSVEWALRRRWGLR